PVLREGGDPRRARSRGGGDGDVRGGPEALPGVVAAQGGARAAPARAHAPRLQGHPRRPTLGFPLALSPSLFGDDGNEAVAQELIGLALLRGRLLDLDGEAPHAVASALLRGH